MSFRNLAAETVVFVGVQLLYERALVAFPVTSHLWLQYARFVETKLKIAAVINGIYERASRNCPWVRHLVCSVLLWMCLLVLPFCMTLVGP